MFLQIHDYIWFSLLFFILPAIPLTIASRLLKIRRSLYLCHDNYIFIFSFFFLNGLGLNKPPLPFSSSTITKKVVAKFDFSNLSSGNNFPKQIKKRFLEKEINPTFPHDHTVISIPFSNTFLPLQYDCWTVY